MRTTISTAAAALTLLLVACDTGSRSPTPGTGLAATTAAAATATTTIAPATSARAPSPQPSGWSAMSSVGAPTPRVSHTATWTGTEMIVWGGVEAGTCAGDHGAYDPATDSWRPLSSAGEPAPRFGHAAVWTGQELIVWGGNDQAKRLGDGGAYDPTTDSWRPLNSAGAPSAREGHSMVWTGSHVIVWGGSGPGGSASGLSLGDGASYDPATDRWTPLSQPAAGLEPRAGHHAFWTGGKMLVFGGATLLGPDSVSGAEFDPQQRSWATLPASYPLSTRREGYSTALAGTQVFVTGGVATPLNQLSNDVAGESYDALSRAWTALPTTGAPLASRGSATWSGREVLVWGGEAQSQPTNQGSAFDPTTRTWRAIPTRGAPEARSRHTAVWTGKELLIWGGARTLQALNSGGRLIP